MSTPFAAPTSAGLPAARHLAILAALACCPAMPATPDERAESPGARFRDCARCPEMIVVPPGTFLMGSPGIEAGRHPNEGPVHEVTIGQAFAMGVHEVTSAEWDACVESGGCNGYRPKQRFFGRNLGGPHHSVIRVGWEDVPAYLAWLSRTAGSPYRLPSEAEWEYAARGGTTTPYYTGNTIAGEEANYGRYFVGRPVPVGSYPANPFGLHDMLGNVAEWCEGLLERELRGCAGRRQRLAIRRLRTPRPAGRPLGKRRRRLPDRRTRRVTCALQAAPSARRRATGSDGRSRRGRATS